MAILISFKEQNQAYIKFLCVKEDYFILGENTVFLYALSWNSFAVGIWVKHC